MRGYFMFFSRHLFLFIISSFLFSLTTHSIVVMDGYYSPSPLSIDQGDTVVWTFVEGNHNVNGSQSAYSQNSESFSCDFGLDTCSHTFNTAGMFGYHSDNSWLDSILSYSMFGMIYIASNACEDTDSVWCYDLQDDGLPSNGMSLEQYCNIPTMAHTVGYFCPQSCLLCGEIPGCTDSAATNYDSTATADDGSCIYCDNNSFDYCGWYINNGPGCESDLTPTKCLQCEACGGIDVGPQTCEEGYCPDGQYLDTQGNCYSCDYCLSDTDDSACTTLSGQDCCGACGGSADGNCAGSGTTCDDVSACNYNQVGACDYAENGFDCFGNCSGVVHTVYIECSTGNCDNPEEFWLDSGWGANGMYSVDDSTPIDIHLGGIDYCLDEGTHTFNASSVNGWGFTPGPVNYCSAGCSIDFFDENGTVILSDFDDTGDYQYNCSDLTDSDCTCDADDSNCVYIDMDEYEHPGTFHATTFTVGGSSDDCAIDEDDDDICDDVDDCVGSLDECGVCNGNGIADGECDCNGSILDAIGVCGGSCAADVDDDGWCADEDWDDNVYCLTNNWFWAYEDGDGDGLPSGPPTDENDFGRIASCKDAAPEGYIFYGENCELPTDLTGIDDYDTWNSENCSQPNSEGVFLWDVNENTTFTINAQNYSYSPSSLTIQIGDTVEWVNQQGFHDVLITSGPYEFSLDSCTGPCTIGSHTFTEPGVYEYICSIGNHASQGMVGTIVVTCEGTAVEDCAGVCGGSAVDD